MLDRATSLRLLPQGSVGRVVYAANALPAIRLANFVVDGDLYFNAVPDSQFRLSPDMVVAFEVDLLDEAARTGWAVTVTGPVEVIPVDATESYLEKIDPWVVDPATRVYRLAMGLVVGHALGHAADQDGWPQPGIVSPPTGASTSPV